MHSTIPLVSLSTFIRLFLFRGKDPLCLPHCCEEYNFLPSEPTTILVYIPNHCCDLKWGLPNRGAHNSFFFFCMWMCFHVSSNWRRGMGQPLVRPTGTAQGLGPFSQQTHTDLDITSGVDKEGAIIGGGVAHAGIYQLCKSTGSF